MNQPLLSVVFATRDRPAELDRAIASCLAQSYRPIEVLVYDDASTSDIESVARRFPDTHYTRAPERQGSIALRNRGFREAKGEYIVSLDDDAYFTAPDTLDQVVRQFRAHAECAVIALPLIEPETGSKTGLVQAGPALAPGTPLRNYRGSAAVLHRERLLQAGAYRVELFHQSEERDLAIRIMELGYTILAGDAPPVVHTPSPTRDRDALDRLGIRNSLLFDVWNIPHPFLCPRIAADVVRLLGYRLNLRNALQRARYILHGLRECWRLRGLRHPVSPKTYRAYARLDRHGPQLMPASRLPPPIRPTVKQP